VLSVNYGTAGLPQNFERILLDGTHAAFSTYSGLTDEVKIATARAGNPANIEAGTLFTGNGLDGEIGDILLAQETVTAGTSGLFRLQWTGAQLEAVAIPLDPTSATVGQWEHVTFAGAGVGEIQ